MGSEKKEGGPILGGSLEKSRNPYRIPVIFNYNVVINKPFVRFVWFNVSHVFFSRHKNCSTLFLVSIVVKLINWKVNKGPNV